MTSLARIISLALAVFSLPAIASTVVTIDFSSDFDFVDSSYVEDLSWAYGGALTGGVSSLEFTLNDGLLNNVPCDVLITSVITSAYVTDLQGSRLDVLDWSGVILDPSANVISIRLQDTLETSFPASTDLRRSDWLMLIYDSGEIVENAGYCGIGQLVLSDYSSSIFFSRDITNSGMTEWDIFQSHTASFSTIPESSTAILVIIGTLALSARNRTCRTRRSWPSRGSADLVAFPPVGRS